MIFVQCTCIYIIYVFTTDLILCDLEIQEIPFEIFEKWSKTGFGFLR